MDDSIVAFLFFITFVIALFYGVVQYFKVKKSRREHHHSVSEMQERAASAGRRDGGMPPGP